MPTCQNCEREWSWQQTFKKMLTFSAGMKCPYCGEKQYYTKQARTRMSVLTFLIPFIIFLTLFEIHFFLLIGIHLFFCKVRDTFLFVRSRVEKCALLHSIIR